MASYADPAKPYWIAHGVLMILAWGFFIPLGALIAVYRRYVGKSILKKQPSFYPMHRTFQTVGFLLTFLAFGLAAAGSKRVYGTGRPFSEYLAYFTDEDIPWNRHVKWGVSVLIISSVQVFSGIWHHFWKPKRNSEENAQPGKLKSWLHRVMGFLLVRKRLLVPSWLHVIMGFLLVLVAYITIFQGLQLYNYIFYKTYIKSGIMAGYVLVSLTGFLFLIAYAIGQLGNLKSGAAEAEKEVVKEEKEEEMEAIRTDVPKEEAALAMSGAAEARQEVVEQEEEYAAETVAVPKEEAVLNPEEGRLDRAQGSEHFA